MKKDGKQQIGGERHLDAMTQHKMFLCFFCVSVSPCETVFYRRDLDRIMALVFPENGGAPVQVLPRVIEKLPDQHLTQT